MTITREHLRTEARRILERHECRDIFAKAIAAGEQAAEACRPVPMIVETHKNMLDDNSPVVEREVVEDGVCGFAWVVIRPGNCSFARWLKKKEEAETGRKQHAGYGGGFHYHIHDYGQSMTRKLAFAGAFTRVLCDHGINAYAQSRMD